MCCLSLSLGKHCVAVKRAGSDRVCAVSLWHHTRELCQGIKEPQIDFERSLITRATLLFTAPFFPPQANLSWLGLVCVLWQLFFSIASPTFHWGEIIGVGAKYFHPEPPHVSMIYSSHEVALARTGLCLWACVRACVCARVLTCASHILCCFIVDGLCNFPLSLCTRLQLVDREGAAPAHP